MSAPNLLSPTNALADYADAAAALAAGWRETGANPDLQLTTSEGLKWYVNAAVGAGASNIDTPPVVLPAGATVVSVGARTKPHAGTKRNFRFDILWFSDTAGLTQINVNSSGGQIVPAATATDYKRENVPVFSGAQSFRLRPVTLNNQVGDALAFTNVQMEVGAVLSDQVVPPAPEEGGYRGWLNDPPDLRPLRGRNINLTDPPDPPDPPATYGPVTRSAPSGSYVTPEQHGAVGNGVADDTTAIAAALVAAAGGTLWLPANKTYRITRLLSIRSNTTIIGAGKNTVWKFTWTGVNSTEGSVNIRTNGNTSQNIHLSNFVLEGGGDGLPGGVKAENPEGLVPLLKLIKLDNFSIKNMELRKAEGLSITATGCTNGVYQYNYVHHSGRDGITQYRNESQNVENIVVDSNLVEKCGDDHIAINGLVPGHNLAALPGGASPLPRGITITNNVIRGWEVDPNGKTAGRGIALNGFAQVRCQNNDISYPPSTGILVTGCNSHICSGSQTDWFSENGEILNNTIRHSRGGSRPGAIAVIKSRFMTITGNHAVDSAPYDFTGATSSTIDNNTQT